MNKIKKEVLFLYKENGKNQNKSLINRLRNDLYIIRCVYKKLYEYNEIGITIDIDGEWILDNLYIIEKEINVCINGLENINVNELPNNNNEIRIYTVSKDIVRYFDGNVNKENIKNFLLEYSKINYLQIKEFWILEIFLKISLINYIKEISEKTLYRHQQKYKVENIIERLIDNKPFNKRKYREKIKSKNNNQINMSFIEYMAYRLKQLESDGLKYIDIFDEQVLKLGITVDDVVSKEHLNIVSKQISIGNSITSLKNINNINFSKGFENINEIDVILSREKAQIYSRMDYETIEMYRKEISNISGNTGIAEKYICDKIIKLCENSNGIKSHCGYYILGDGIYELYKCLNLSYNSENRVKNINKNLGIYLSYIIGGSIFVTLIFSYLSLNNTTFIEKYLYFFLMNLLIIIPVSQLLVVTIDKFILKTIKPRNLPALDFTKGIPDNCKTFVIVPTLLNSTKRVEELITNLEMYYLLNKQENIFFALLGDCSEIDEKYTKLDDEIIEKGKEKIKELNEKYNFEIPKFYFLYRDRVFNNGQKKYLGWERKRGMITQFNRFLLYGEKGHFNTNDIDINKTGRIKYVLTIDADTHIGFDCIAKLTGTMAHTLNTPILNNEQTRVVSGYGILQPRISVNIECANKNIFSALYAGYGGTDIYTNAVSDVYQDVWGEGSFTGKGIYDLETFSKVLDNQIPINTVLSHDLLEGSYIRCGLVTNVEFIDGYPSRYNNYIVRQNRWLRGDIQILDWIKDRIKVEKEDGKKITIKNPLNKLSRWKILDNLRRGLLDISIFLFVLLGLSLLNIKWQYVVLFVIGIYMYPIMLDYLLNFKSALNKYNKNYIKIIGSFEGVIYRTIIEIIFLPYKAITNIDTFIRTKYRMRISKKYLLEWLTAEQAEKVLGKDLKTYIREMYISALLGGIMCVLTSFFSTYSGNIVCSIVLGILWVLSPFVAWYISREKNTVYNLELKDRIFLTEVARDTWNYFYNYLNSKNNYLIPDNYQENRHPQVAGRTSCTDIGLSFISVMTAYDLKFIDKQVAYNLIQNILNTTDKLEKYKGNLYNWYNIKTLKPLDDNISSVDSGNYVAYLYVLKSFCKEVFDDVQLIKKIDRQIKETDLSLLFNKEKQLFNIVYNTRTEKLAGSYYDLFASEARILSFVAIAKGNVSYKHWYKMSRTLASKYGYKGLLSWAGTSFEYFMPYGLMKSYKYSLLDETYKFAFLNQFKYVQKKKIPWGISESAYNLYDTEYNYQYKGFGVPILGLKRGLKDDLVISPYASIITLTKYPKLVLDNMHNLKKIDAYGKYGYYESIDYTKNRIGNKEKEIVKTFMAHHQGLILTSINNILNNQVFQKRFQKNVEIKAIDVLLQEKVVDVFVINKKESEKFYEGKENSNSDVYVYSKHIERDESKNQYNVISNKDYVISINNKGNGYSKINNILPYRYNMYDEDSGIQIFSKDRNTGDIVNLYKNSEIICTQYNSTYIKEYKEIEYETTISCLYEGTGEIRNVKIKNNSKEEKQVDVFFYLEPILSDMNSDISHRAYNNMFLEYIKSDKGLIVHRRKGKEEEKLFMGACLCSDTTERFVLEFEIDRYRFLGRNKSIIESNSIGKDIILSNNLTQTIEPIIAYKAILKLNPGQIINLAYIQGVNKTKEDVEDSLLKYSNYENIKTNEELLFGKAVIENKFYKYTKEELMNFNEILQYFVSLNRSMIISNLEDSKTCKQANLWKIGISGDKPILMIIVNRKIENILVKEVLKCFKYIRTKKLDMDLVINIKCNEQYTNEIQEEIIKLLHIVSINYELNNSIFILTDKDLDNDSKATLDIVSVLKLNGTNGILSNQIKKINIEKSNSENKKNLKVRKANIPDNIEVNTDNLLYYNDIGGFVKDTGEYRIILKNNYTTPAPWSNILTNKEFGTLVNENGGGFTWNKNSRQNKLTAWKNDQVLDYPSEYMVIEEDEKIWSTTLSPYRVNNATYIITHGFGYTCYETSINNIYSTEYIFVPNNENVKICFCKLKNNSKHKRRLKVSYNLQIILGENGFNNIYQIEENKNCIFVKEVYKNKEYDEILYLSPSVDNVVDNMQSYVSCPNSLNIKISIDIEIDPYEEKSIIILFGQEKNKEETLNIIEKYQQKNNVLNELEKVKNSWKEINNHITIKTPVESMNILVNNWLLYQTISSRLYSRTGYYQNGGAFGFRDQLQDTIGIMLTDKILAKRQIIYHSQHQFLEGDVQHWWHMENNVGLRARYTDDLLWLPYITLEYIKITGDKDILNVETSYMESNELKEYEKDRYEIPKISNIKESIYFHNIRAINKALVFGENDLPYMGGGDWNDGFNNIYGQSVWLGFFLYDILKRFIPFVKEEDISIKYKEAIIRLKNGLKKSWDGKWYKRAYFKDGKELGTISNEECKIDSISQSWAVISDFIEAEKNIIALESVNNMLVDRDNKIIKLFTPSFDKSNLSPGYVKEYLPGIRENGGQYTHEYCDYGQFYQNIDTLKYI